MPKLSLLTEAKQEARVIDVLMLTIDGESTIEEACQVVGMPPSTFYDWLRRGSDTIDAFRSLLAEQQRIQLLQINAARFANIRTVAKTVMDPEQKITMKDRKLADSMLSKYGDELESSLHAAPGFEEAASKFLSKGPKLKQQRSRLASMEISSSEDGLRVDVYKDEDIIDAEAKDTD